LRDKAGLSKFRNTLQSEMSKNLNDGWRFRGILRGSYDGVYDLNKNQYGEGAGGAVEMGNGLGPYVNTNPHDPNAPGPFPATVPYAGGIVDWVYGAANLPGVGAFASAYGSQLPSITYINQVRAAGSLPAMTQAQYDAALRYSAVNVNQGLAVVGSGWHAYDNRGLTFATPVRPCNVDPRGCIDFGGYGNKTKNELAFPEFNDRLDFIREAYVTKTVGMDGGQSTFLKIGRQQVVWGRTDLFRVLDVINPVDYSRNNIYDELQDIRIPMFIAQAEYRMGASENMQDRNLSVVWNFDRFRPNNLGQGGTPNSILDAGGFFRAMSMCYEYGCTVGNFAAANPNNPAGGGLATNFGPGQIGIKGVDLPNWSLSNTQLGMKFEGITKEGLSFSVNGLTYRSQLPSLRGMQVGQNPFTGNGYNTNALAPSAGANPFPNAIPMNGSYIPLFEVVYPRVNLIGGSMDLQVESIGAALRLEGAYTRGEEFANTLRPEMYSKNPVWRSVIGLDRPTFVPFISTERTVLFSGQLFYQHIFNHETAQRPWGMSGMPDWKDNAIATLLMKAFLMNDRVSPEIIFARDFRAQANVIAPAVEWIYTDNLKLKFGANVKFGHEQSNWGWSSAHTANPLAPFTNQNTSAVQNYDFGYGGLEPLGRFRAGPIGTAFGQNEVYATLRYKF